MHLSDSRSTSTAKEQLKSTRGSFFLKATGRDVKPPWTNRIIKDFNDLDYDVNTDRFSNINRFTNTALLKKQKIQADLRKKRPSKRRVGPIEDETNQVNKRKSTSRRRVPARVGVTNP